MSHRLQDTERRSSKFPDWMVLVSQQPQRTKVTGCLGQVLCTDHIRQRSEAQINNIPLDIIKIVHVSMSRDLSPYHYIMGHSWAEHAVQILARSTCGTNARGRTCYSPIRLYGTLGLCLEIWKDRRTRGLKKKLRLFSSPSPGSASPAPALPAPGSLLTQRRSPSAWGGSGIPLTHGDRRIMELTTSSLAGTFAAVNTATTSFSSSQTRRVLQSWIVMS
ncbi:hypothetical protein RRG08_049910 [Elysia crispata]|uniref:Uncharacterized protein n=1 Tax=Elysia crispata TaxID=231223 RepID=A0AAE1CQ19_9GAST|nr:hypothetical protein RRG08_049910 [Elysia crispata]